VLEEGFDEGGEFLIGFVGILFEEGVDELVGRVLHGFKSIIL
jgi:hypothetical protein